MTWATESRRRAELPADWPETRKRILNRDGRRCRWILPSKKRCPRPATDVDHVGSRFDHSDTNLRSLCGDHHAKVTARQGVRARRPRKRDRRQEAHPGRRA